MTADRGAVLVTAATARSLGDRLSEILAGRARLQLLEAERAPEAAELADVAVAFMSTDLMKASNKQALNPALETFSRAVESAPRLRWLHACSSGTDRPLLQRAMARGVTVTSSTGANAQAVAHSAMAGLLALARGVPRWVRDQDATHWRAPAAATMPRDLGEMRALIVGLGAVGGQIARACRGLGMRVTGVRRHAAPSADCDEVADLGALARLLPHTDVLILACALNEQTHGLVDAKTLALLPPGAWLVNVSRGEVIDEPALFDAARAGRLGGVYADVFVQEPLPPDSPWWTLPSALISPHAAGLSAGFAARTREMFLDNLARWVAGRDLLNVARR